MKQEEVIEIIPDAEGFDISSDYLAESRSAWSQTKFITEFVAETMVALNSFNNETYTVGCMVAEDDFTDTLENTAEIF